MKNKKRNILIAVSMILTVLILVTIDHLIPEKSEYPIAEAIIDEFAEENRIKKKEYPDELKRLLEKNPETEEFVLNYPLRKDVHEAFSMDEYENINEVPHLLQWDMRWG